jgi:hypothetical protein
MKSTACSQHEICFASDSKLPVCKCWCAQCKEEMATARKAFKLGGADRIAEIARAVKAVK